MSPHWPPVMARYYLNKVTHFEPRTENCTFQYLISSIADHRFQCQHWHCGKSTALMNWTKNVFEAFRVTCRYLSQYSQELEIVIGDEHISFTTSKIGSLIDVNQSKWVLNPRAGKLDTVYLSLTKGHSFKNCTVFQGPWRSSCVLLPGARSEMSCLQSHRSTLQDQAHLKCGFCLF